MSRREARDSDSKRHRSRFDREPSPKRSRRDGKPATERVPINIDLDIRDHTDRDQKHRRRLQDAVPLEASSAPDSKVETRAVIKESEKEHTYQKKESEKEHTYKKKESEKEHTYQKKESEKEDTYKKKESEKEHNGHHEGTERSSNPTEIPRSRSYFQHDERGNARQVGRSFGRGAATDRGWRRDAKDEHNERAADKPAINDTRPRDEKSQAKGDNNSVQRHDKLREMEGDPPPHTRKRPAFREKKIQVDSENADKAAIEPEKESHPAVGSERREDKRWNSRHLDRPERPSTRDRVPNRGDARRRGLPSRERYGGNYGVRDRFSGRQGYRASGTRDDTKWEHDLFVEASKSPPRKNEEDQIAKVEALLASK